jgi:hypothetical protein
LYNILHTLWRNRTSYDIVIDSQAMINCTMEWDAILCLYWNFSLCWVLINEISGSNGRNLWIMCQVACIKVVVEIILHSAICSGIVGCGSLMWLVVIIMLTVMVGFM